MISDVLYRDIDRMIQKRLKDNGNRAYGKSGTSDNLGVNTPVGSGNDGKDGSNGNSGKDGKDADTRLTCASFVDYDYKLLYNEDEDLIAVTSYSGFVRYDFLKDDDGDLIGLYIHSEILDAYVGLIYENYDVRNYLTWTDSLDIFDKNSVADDKGKLVEVVLISCSTYIYPLTLVITPKNQKLEIGGTHQFESTVTNDDTSSDIVTKECIWTIDGENTIDVGLVTAGEIGGIFELTATYIKEINNKSFELTAKATIEVAIKIVRLEVTPLQSSKDVGVGSQYVATAYYNDNSEKVVTDNCTWIIDTNASITKGFAISSLAGIYNLKASYDNLNASATYETIFVRKAIQLKVTPDTINSAPDIEQTYIATLYYNDNTTEDVTTICGWIIDSPAIKLGNGKFKSSEFGVFTITASHLELTGNATLNIEQTLLPNNRDFVVVVSWENGDDIDCCWAKGPGELLVTYSDDQYGDGDNKLYKDTDETSSNGSEIWSINGKAVDSVYWGISWFGEIGPSGATINVKLYEDNVLINEQTVGTNKLPVSSDDEGNYRALYKFNLVAKTWEHADLLL